MSAPYRRAVVCGGRDGCGAFIKVIPAWEPNQTPVSSSCDKCLARLRTERMVLEALAKHDEKGAA